MFLVFVSLLGCLCIAVQWEGSDSPNTWFWSHSSVHIAVFAFFVSFFGWGLSTHSASRSMRLKISPVCSALPLPAPLCSSFKSQFRTFTCELICDLITSLQTNQVRLFKWSSTNLVSFWIAVLNWKIFAYDIIRSIFKFYFFAEKHITHKLSFQAGCVRSDL